MNSRTTMAATALRLTLGWFMLIDGIEHLLMPGWTAKEFLLQAKTFPGFYAWFALPANLVWIDPLNQWGITLIGIALLLGVFVRPAAWAGAALMVIYYFPHYQWPVVTNGFIVDEHLIEAAAFVLIAVLPEAQSFGLSRYVRSTFLCRVPLLGALI